jgi:hypothetical protein
MPTIANATAICRTRLHGAEFRYQKPNACIKHAR